MLDFAADQAEIVNRFDFEANAGFDFAEEIPLDLEEPEAEFGIVDGIASEIAPLAGKVASGLATGAKAVGNAAVKAGGTLGDLGKEALGDIGKIPVGKLMSGIRIPKVGKLNLSPMSPKGAAAQAIRKFGEGAVSKLEGLYSRFAANAPRAKYLGNAIEHARTLQGQGPIPVASLLEDVPTASMVAEPAPKLQAPRIERTINTTQPTEPPPTTEQILGGQHEGMHGFNLGSVSSHFGENPVATHNWLDSHLRSKVSQGWKVGMTHQGQTHLLFPDPATKGWQTHTGKSVDLRGLTANAPLSNFLPGVGGDHPHFGLVPPHVWKPFAQANNIEFEIDSAVEELPSGEWLKTHEFHDMLGQADGPLNLDEPDEVVAPPEEAPAESPTPPKIDEDSMRSSHDVDQQMHDVHGESDGPISAPPLDDAIPKGESEHKIEGDSLEPVEDEAAKARQSSTKSLSSSLSKSYAKLPAAAKAVIAKNTPNVAFFSDPAKLTAELAKVSPEAADRAAEGQLYHGAIVPPSRQLLVAGSASPEQTEDIHAYELSRAMADGRDKGGDWTKAVSADKAGETLSGYASDPQRAWGMFGVLVNRHEVSAEELATRFPAMTAVWKGYGLIPTSSKKPLVETMEIFRPAAAIYDDQANADAAYTPKEAGLATFSRIGRNSMDWLKQNAQLVGDWGKKVIDSVPPSIRTAAVGMLRKTYYTYYLANQASMNVAKARGMDDRKAKLLSAALTGADAILGGKVLPIAAAAAAKAATGSSLAGLGVYLGTGFVPVGSLAYITLMMGAPAAIKTFQAAKGKVSALLAKKKPDAAFADDAMETIANHVAGLDERQDEWWLACFLSAMDETQGNVAESCRLADDASKDGPDFEEETKPDSPTPAAPKAQKPAAPTVQPLIDDLGLVSNTHNAVQALKQNKIPAADLRKHLAGFGGTGYVNKPSDPLKFPEKATDLGNVLHVPGHEADVVGMEDFLKGKPHVTKGEVLKHLEEKSPKFQEVSQANMPKKWRVWDSGSEEEYDSEEKARDAREGWVENLMDDPRTDEIIDERFERLHGMDGVDYEKVEPEEVDDVEPEEKDGKWWVGGDDFDTEDEAREAAEAETTQLRDQAEEDAEEENDKRRERAEEEARQEIGSNIRDENERDVRMEEIEDQNAGVQTESYSLGGPKSDYDEIHITAPTLSAEHEPKPLLDPGSVTAKIEDVTEGIDSGKRIVTFRDHKGQDLRTQVVPKNTDAWSWTPEQLADHYRTQQNARTEAENAKAATEKRSWADGHGFYDHIENPVVRARHDIRTDADGKKMFFLEELQVPKEDEKMPQWLRDKGYDIGIKAMIRKAVQSGADRLGWTTGKQQADRYNLASHVDSIDWATQPTGSKVVTFNTKKSGPVKATVDADGYVTEAPDDHWIGKPFEDVIGEEVSDDILTEAAGKKEGKDLEIGGEGLKSLYDKMIPGKVKEILKKHGAKIGKSEVESKGKTYQPRTSYGNTTREGIPVIDNKTGETLGVFSDNDEAYRFITANKLNHTIPVPAQHEHVHSIELTPAIKKWALSGIPMFSEDEEDVEGVADFAGSRAHDVSGEKRDSDGKWTAGGAGKAKDKATADAEPAKGVSAQAAEIVKRVKPTKKRAFEGKQVEAAKISKQLAGAIGEEIIIQHLKSRGLKDARHLNVERNNFAIDLVQDHESVEVKTGQVSNGSGAQQWRMTIGEPGKAEKEWMATLNPEEIAAWNADKQKQITERKKKALAQVSEHLGKPVKAKTMTVLLNPETKTADIYSFDGWHDRIGWNSEEAKKAYLGSVTYA